MSTRRDLGNYVDGCGAEFDEAISAARAAIALAKKGNPC
jgi:hypothetical protein